MNLDGLRRVFFGSDSYALVFVLFLAVMVFAIAAPGNRGAWLVSNVIYLVAAAAALWTSASTPAPLRARVLIPLGLLILAAIGVAAAVDSTGTAAALGSLLIAFIGVVIVYDLVTQGAATWQAALGVLTLYVLIGILFGSLYSVVAAFEGGSFFANDTEGTLSDHLYFSYTTLTTTGYGDYAAASGIGRALAALEMVAGELFLVTVVAVAVARLTRLRVERALEQR